METTLESTRGLSDTNALVNDLTRDSSDGNDEEREVEIDSDGNITIREMESLPSCGSTASYSDTDSASDNREGYTGSPGADERPDQHIEDNVTKEPLHRTKGCVAATDHQPNGLDEQICAEKYESTAADDRDDAQNALTTGAQQLVEAVGEDTEDTSGGTLVQKSTYEHKQSSTCVSDEISTYKSITRVNYTRSSNYQPPLMMSDQTLGLDKTDGGLETNGNADQSQRRASAKPHTVLKPQITNGLLDKQTIKPAIFASLDLPYVMAVEHGLTPGLAISIDAYIWRISRSVEIQLLGELHAMVMKIACQGDTTRVTLKTFVNDTSTAEAFVEGRLSIHRSQRVLIKIVAQRKIFKVYVDEQHFLDYEHKLPLNKLNQLLLNGEMFLYDVVVNKSTQSSRPPWCCMCCC